MVRTTVIVSACNYGRFLKLCLTSIKNQSVKPDEIIVVDVASTDNTKEVCDTFDNITYIKLEERVGQTDAIKTGLHSCKYKEGLVFLLDADDTWGPKYISSMLSEYNSKYQVMFSDVIYVGNISAKQGMFFNSTPIDTIDDPHKWVGSITSATVVTWGLLDKILTGIGEHTRDWPYVDQVVNMASNALNIPKYFIRTDQVYYRIHGDNLWWSDWTEDKWKAYEKVNHNIVDYFMEKL